MSDARSNGRDQFRSKIFRDFGESFGQTALKELDYEAFKAELAQETTIASQDKQIQELRDELELVRDKLRKLQNSRFKSAEREAAIPDSSLGDTYTTLISEIKSFIFKLTRSIDGGAMKVLEAMKESKVYKEGLQRVLEPNITVQEFVSLLEKSDSPPKLLAFILRAIVMNILRLKLFNSNVFLSIGGENWKQLREVYRHLLTAGLESHGKEHEILEEPGDDRFRRDASLWRSQTLSTLDRNKERLKLENGQAALLERLVADIEELLSPLVKSTEQKQDVRESIKSIVNSAAGFSIQLGKQRAMFELEPKRYIGYKVQPDMDQFGPWAPDNEGLEQSRTTRPAEILAVIAPALFKFGNDDGEDFEQHKIVRKAHVLVLPPKASEASEPSADMAPSAASLAIVEETLTITNSEGEGVAARANTSVTSQDVEMTPPPPDIDTTANKASVDEGSNEAPPPPPKDDPKAGEALTKGIAEGTIAEPKTISSEFSKESKVRVNNQKSNTSSSQRSHEPHLKSKTTKKT